MISWVNPGRTVILASNSPRRRKIMAGMGFTFTTAAPVYFDETEFMDPGNIASSVRRLARAKADSVASSKPQALVLGADTVVVRNRTILGKPSSRREARRMLTMLSGSKHRVYTGVALSCRAGAFSADAVACTDVFFRKLTVDEIEEYLALGEYRDKAGSYGIQGRAMTFVERIRGCYYNVVGLPVSKTICLFRKYLNGVSDDSE